MKYYPRKYLFGFIIIPFIGAALCFLILALIARAVTDDNLSVSLILELFFVPYFLLLAWMLYSNRLKDYFELTENELRHVFDSRRKRPSILIPAHEIRLLELSTYPNSTDKFCRIYAESLNEKEHDGYLQIDEWEIPCDAIAAFCTKNKIEPNIITVNNDKFADVTFKKDRIIIDYYDRKKRKTTVRLKNIMRVIRISQNPVSVTNRIYRIETTDGKCYEFSYSLIGSHLETEQYFREKGIEFIKQIHGS